MSLVFTYLCATNQGENLTLDGTLDFHINLVQEKGITSDVLDKAMKNDLIANNFSIKIILIVYQFVSI